MLRLNNIRVALPMRETLVDIAARKLRCSPADIQEVTVVRRSVDARRKPHIFFVFTLQVSVKNEKTVLRKFKRDESVRKIEETKADPIVYGSERLPHRPIVVGTGPAGLGAALTLAEHGYCPLVLERGYDVERRSTSFLGRRRV